MIDVPDIPGTTVTWAIWCTIGNLPNVSRPSSSHLPVTPEFAFHRGNSILGGYARVNLPLAESTVQRVMAAHNAFLYPGQYWFTEIEVSAEVPAEFDRSYSDLAVFGFSVGIQQMPARPSEPVISLVAIPEPSLLSLLAIALGSCALRRKRRNCFSN